MLGLTLYSTPFKVARYRGALTDAEAHKVNPSTLQG